VDSVEVFACQACGQVLYFENVRCESCRHALGYLPDHTTISALVEQQNGHWSALAAESAPYRYCKNFESGVCNWMVPVESEEIFCAACRHNKTIPDLSLPENLDLWRKLEAAKHRLIYSLLKFGLPLQNQADDPARGLAFEFLGEAQTPHAQRVMTGHDNGVITLALEEADDAKREQARAQMGEPYRTLLGHFRHEIGHYYWNILVRDGGNLESFRATFGAEGQDYAAALQSHYSDGPPADWRQNFVTAYASAHPWEDFAETWAHYLHIVDTLETARSFGVKVRTRGNREAKKEATVDFDPHSAPSIESLIGAWLPLCFAVNSLNRSMGQADLYPFVLAPAAIAKLGYVHELMHEVARSGT
jgi:hypothetical protein